MRIFEQHPARNLGHNFQHPSAGSGRRNSDYIAAAQQCRRGHQGAFGSIGKAQRGARPAARKDQGDPPILIGRVSGTGDKGILISVFVLQEGEDRIVADRLHALLDKASK